MITKNLLARTCPEPSAPPASRARHPRCVIERRLRLCSACHLCPQSFSVASCLTVAENPKPFTYKVLRDILHSRPLWYPHQPRSHGSTPTSVPLAPLLPQTHQILPALPLDTIGSSCLSGLSTLLFWRGKVAPPRASVSSDLVYRGLFSSSGCVYVWHTFIWYVYFHFHLFPPKVKLYKDMPASVFTAKSSGLGRVSGGIHITTQQKTSALHYLNLISFLKFVISEFWNSKSPWSLTFKGLNNAFCTSPLLFNYLYHNPLWISEWYKAFKPPIT